MWPITTGILVPHSSKTSDSEPSRQHGDAQSLSRTTNRREFGSFRTFTLRIAPSGSIKRALPFEQYRQLTNGLPPDDHRRRVFGDERDVKPPLRGGREDGRDHAAARRLFDGRVFVEHEVIFRFHAARQRP